MEQCIFIKSSDYVDLNITMKNVQSTLYTLQVPKKHCLLQAFQIRIIYNTILIRKSVTQRSKFEWSIYALYYDLNTQIWLYGVIKWLRQARQVGYYNVMFTRVWRQRAPRTLYRTTPSGCGCLHSAWNSTSLHCNHLTRSIQKYHSTRMIYAQSSRKT